MPHKSWRRTIVSILCMGSGTSLDHLMYDCPTTGSPGCSDLCPGLSEDPMSNGAFRVRAEDLSSVSDGYVSLLFLKSVDVPLLLSFSSVPSVWCLSSVSFVLLCFLLCSFILLSHVFLLLPPLFNSFSVSGDWQQWDLIQGGASEKK